MNAGPVPGDRLQAILSAGIQAPSAENRHYLRFEPCGSGVALIATDTASWQDGPHRRWLALLSYGAVVENMELRAGALGLAQQVHWQPDRTRPERIAELEWAPAEVRADGLAAAIDERHTNRRFYRRQAVGPAALARLARAAVAVPGAGVLWCDAPGVRADALRAIRLAETERFRRRDLHAELFSAVRFEQGWRGAADEGLPPGALEVEPPMRLPFAALRHWPLMRGACFLGAHVALGLRAGYLPCALAPHLGVVMADGGAQDERDLRAGRALQRVWLAAQSEGLAFQPFAAPVALSRQRPGGGWVSQALQRRLTSLLDALSTARSGRPAMFFRVGRAAAPGVRTGRLPLECYRVESSGNDR